MRRLLMLVTLSMVVFFGATPAVQQSAAVSRTNVVASAPLIPCSNGVPMPC